MQHLGEKWLKIANFSYALFAFIFISIVAILSFLQGSLVVNNEQFGISILSISAAILTIVYCLLIYRLVRKYSLWIAYVTGFLFFAFLVSSSFEASVGGQAELLLMLFVIFLNVFSVLYGPITALTVIGISGSLLALEIADNASATSLGKQKDIIVFFIRTILSFFLLFIFRKNYITDTPKDQSYVVKYFVNNEVVKLLTNSLGDGVIIIDKDEIIKTVNPAAVEILGQDAKDILDLNYRSVLKFKNINGSTVSSDKEPVTLALQVKKSIREELLLLKKNKTIYVDVTVSAIANEENHIYGAIITLRDISAKKKEEAAKSEFISTASHEMRTPVAAIEGYLALALNPNVSKIDPKTKAFLEKAYASTQHLGQLFQDLLVSTRAEDGRITSHPQVVEIGEILKKQAEYFAFSAQKKGLQLEFLVSTLSRQKNNDKTIKPLYYIYADPARIQEVTSNLIDNAIKYTESGKITLGLTGDRNLVQVFIRDTGAGIDAEDVPHLFQKFYRVDSSATRTTGGTGLGLFICRKIVELYKGQIWVQSKKGQGSTFYINLPRLDSTQANAMIMSESSKKSGQL